MRQKNEVENSAYRYCVITWVPELGHAGNVITVSDLLRRDGKKWEPAQANAHLQYKSPAFLLGEIMILDNDGVEISGRARKPESFYVRAEMFSTLHQAVLCSREATRMVELEAAK